ncbi:hypothetical protein [Gluconobacter oxydans]
MGQERDRVSHRPSGRHNGPAARGPRPGGRAIVPSSRLRLRESI